MTGRNYIMSSKAPGQSWGDTFERQQSYELSRYYEWADLAWMDDPELRVRQPGARYIGRTGRILLILAGLAIACGSLAATAL